MARKDARLVEGETPRHTWRSRSYPRSRRKMDAMIVARPRPRRLDRDREGLSSGISFRDARIGLLRACRSRRADRASAAMTGAGSDRADSGSAGSDELVHRGARGGVQRRHVLDADGAESWSFDAWPGRCARRGDERTGLRDRAVVRCMSRGHGPDRPTRSRSASSISVPAAVTAIRSRARPRSACCRRCRPAASRSRGTRCRATSPARSRTTSRAARASTTQRCQIRNSRYPISMIEAKQGSAYTALVKQTYTGARDIGQARMRAVRRARGRERGQVLEEPTYPTRQWHDRERCEQPATCGGD